MTQLIPNNTLFLWFNYKRRAYHPPSCVRKLKSIMSFFSKSLVFFLVLQVNMSQEKTHVRITNKLDNGFLALRCQSKNDDLGVHVLYKDDLFEWSFKPNFFPVNTLFFCRLQWKAKVMSFDAYRESRDNFVCNSKCYWNVTAADGACLVKIVSGGNYFCVPWPY